MLVQEEPKSGVDAFISGMLEGLELSIKQLLPNIVVAFTLIKFLSSLEVFDQAAAVAAPIMQVWGLPGESSLILITAVISNAAAVGVAMSLFSGGIVDEYDLTVLFAAIYSVGALMQFSARVLAVIGVPRSRWPIMWFIAIINAVIALSIGNALFR